VWLCIVLRGGLLLLTAVFAQRANRVDIAGLRHRDFHVSSAPKVSFSLIAHRRIKLYVVA